MPVWKRQEVQALSWRLIPGGGQGFVPGRIRLSLIQPGAGSNFSHPVAVCPLLKSLHISGYALIDNIDVEFGSGLNIITGETGAGKSILLGALKLILTQPFDIDAVPKIFRGDYQNVSATLDVTRCDITCSKSCERPPVIRRTLAVVVPAAFATIPTLVPL